MSEERCVNCRFWDDSGDEEDAKPRTGDCRRFPPVRNLLPDDDYTEAHRLWSQPTTGGHWWCGEWQPVRQTTVIQWFAAKDEPPPIGRRILTTCSKSGYFKVVENTLKRGGKTRMTPDENLLYWDGGEDFNEVTHWAELSPMRGGE